MIALDSIDDLYVLLSRRNNRVRDEVLDSRLSNPVVGDTLYLNLKLGLALEKKFSDFFDMKINPSLFCMKNTKMKSVSPGDL